MYSHSGHAATPSNYSAPTNTAQTVHRAPAALICALRCWSSLSCLRRTPRIRNEQRRERQRIHDHLRPGPRRVHAEQGESGQEREPERMAGGDSCEREDADGSHPAIPHDRPPEQYWASHARAVAEGKRAGKEKLVRAKNTCPQCGDSGAALRDVAREQRGHATAEGKPQSRREAEEMVATDPARSNHADGPVQGVVQHVAEHGRLVGPARVLAIHVVAHVVHREGNTSQRPLLMSHAHQTARRAQPAQARNDVRVDPRGPDEREPVIKWRKDMVIQN
eukprot:scaffold4035_cov132-Isochrysis_galbana.AAC.13